MGESKSGEVIVFQEKEVVGEKKGCVKEYIFWKDDKGHNIAQGKV